MSEPITVDILSDDEEKILSSPPPTQPKRQKTTTKQPISNPTVFIIEDDTPQKQPNTNTPSFVPETPLSDSPQKTHYSFLKSCTSSQLRSSSLTPHLKSPEINGLICLESDNESEFVSPNRFWKKNETTHVAFEAAKESELSSRFIDSKFSLGNASTSQMCGDSSLHPVLSEDDVAQVHDNPDEELDTLQPTCDASRPKGRNKDTTNKKGNTDEAAGRKRISKEEKIRLMEEKKQKKEQEKLEKAALKAEAMEMKKQQKEMQKWEKGKLALKSIVAEIDTKVVELGSVGGHLLTRFAEKGVSYRITSNPIERSIVWTMTVPEQISQISSGGIEIPYVLIVYEANEFCDLVTSESLMDHVSRVRSRYPSHTVCYLTNRLMAYINKREQGQYKDPGSYSGWKRPPVEEVLSKLSTYFVRVHSRLCIDEAELAEHVVGLTSSLASCQFRKKLTRLSVNANGLLIPKDCVDKALIKKNLWLKALIAIPKVQPRFAIAISKKYPTMKSLLGVYMDPSKSVHEKEFLLKDLTTEGLLGDDRRLGEICSKRVYRIIMAQSGSIKTDDVEDGADFFSHQSS